MPADATPSPAEIGPESIRDAVRERYAASARVLLDADGDPGCCAPGDCDPITRDLYGIDEAGVVPSGALAASLGCGSPTALIDLEPGQVVLDLGSGGGIDVLLSARRVAPGGTAYGLDMTPEMIELAERHRAEAGVDNAEFLLGSMEDIPLPDGSVDVVISNCVINLAADKDTVLREAFRVLRPGGRLAVSDVVLRRPLPEELMADVVLWTGCVAGALVDSDYLGRLDAAGFVDASIEVTRELDLGSDERLAGAVASAFVRASRP